MIAKTFFLTRDSHRMSTLSLREKLSLRDHGDRRCLAYLVYDTKSGAVSWAARPAAASCDCDLSAYRYDQMRRYRSPRVMGELAEFFGGPPIRDVTQLLFGVFVMVT